MSLKAFHVFFIIIATLLTIVFGIWGIHAYMQTADFTDLIMGIASFIGTIILVWYFRWFLKKLKKVSYL
jgi:hypothetical protein